MYVGFYAGSKMRGTESFVGVFDDEGAAWAACREAYGQDKGLRDYYEVKPCVLNVAYGEYATDDDEPLDRKTRIQMTMRDLLTSLTDTSCYYIADAAARIIGEGENDADVRLACILLLEGAENTKVEGFIGGADYLRDAGDELSAIRDEPADKPVDPKEQVVRLQANLRAAVGPFTAWDHYIDSAFRLVRDNQHSTLLRDASNILAAGSGAAGAAGNLMVADWLRKTAEAFQTMCKEGSIDVA